MRREKYQRYDCVNTLCWECKWATGLEGKCPWVSKGQAVKGWKAERTTIKSARVEYTTDSYFVKKCPLFEPDGR